MVSHITPVLWTVASIAVLAAGLVLARLLAWISAAGERHQQKVRKTVIAEYDAPKQLSPAELGYIFDATFADSELLATVAQLYAKRTVWLQPLSDNDFRITPSKEDLEVLVDDGEGSVLGYLRSLPEGQVSWSRLSSTVSDVAGGQADFEDAVLESLVGKGLLYPSALSGVLFRKRFGSFIFATLASLAVAIPLYEWGRATVDTGLNAGFASLDADVALLIFVPIVFALWLLWFVYANLVASTYVHRNGVPAGATRQLENLWPDVAGFRLFLQETEYVRLQHDADPRDPSMAYCLALGLDPGFARSLKS